MTDDGLLLDTCFVLWSSARQPVTKTAIEAVNRARKNAGTIAVSVMSAWEIGMLVSKGRLPSIRTPERWFEEFVEAAAVTVEGVTPRILVAASHLPGTVHSDPVDRMLIATAREQDLTIITRDRAILAYAAQGHVRAIAC
ncbi:PilT protein-like protein [Mesorhizobium sp. ORS 3359]|nr:PilT protein-like protein [Mesorhizobium sp. ORS 3359]